MLLHDDYLPKMTSFIKSIAKYLIKIYAIISTCLYEITMKLQQKKHLPLYQTIHDDAQCSTDINLIGRNQYISI